MADCKEPSDLLLEEVCRSLRYDLASGWFIRVEAAERQARLIGQRAGCEQRGYRRIMMVRGADRRLFKEHQLAWFFQTGVWPMQPIDHKDRDGCNNAWSNLRLATPAQNSQNRTLHKRSKTGVTGVWWDEVRKNYKVHLKIPNSNRIIQRRGFKTLEDAKSARRALVQQYHHPDFWVLPS